MKLKTLFTLLCLATVNAVDFDGDGIDDSTVVDNSTCTGQDCWYKSDEV